jgi:hypothetical protein
MPSMVQEKLQVGKEAALLMAYAEKPFRDLVHNADKSAYEPGMASAKNTLITLAGKAALQQIPTIPTDLPEHQEHIVNAANQYVRFVSGDSESRGEGEIFYSGFPDNSPVVANQTREVLAILGATEVLQQFGSQDAHIEIWDSAIDGFNLRQQTLFGEVTIFPIAAQAPLEQ